MTDKKQSTKKPPMAAAIRTFVAGMKFRSQVSDSSHTIQGPEKATRREP
jgi:hypothetical protein